MLVTLLTQQGGILKPFSWIMGVILNAIYEFVSLFGIHNIAICIIIFTIVTRMLMLPMTIKQQKFTKVSSRMNPEIQAVTEKYKGKKDPESQRKYQQETQEIYDRYGTTPMGGCLPLLITLPIMFALYRVIYKVPAYVNDIYVLYEAIVNAFDSLVVEIGGQGMVSNIISNFVNGNEIKNAAMYISEVGKYSFGTIDYTKAVIDVITQFNASNWSLFMEGALLETESWTALLAATGQTADTWIGYLQTTIGADYMTKLAGMTDINQLGSLLGIANLGDTVVLTDVSNCIYWNTFSLATDMGSKFSSLNLSSIVSAENLLKIQNIIETDVAPNVSVIVDGILSNNKFIGKMNILDNSGWKFPGILIPIFAAATQLLQSKLTTAANDTGKKKSQSDNPMEQSMKSFSTFMPIMSGVICVMLPIGVGLYWIAGTVVQIVQQIFINKYLSKVDTDELIAKSVEKQNKKRAKMGIRTNSGDGAVSSVARTSTKSVNTSATKTNSVAPKEYERPAGGTGSGSIADIANMLKNRNND